MSKKPDTSPTTTTKTTSTVTQPTYAAILKKNLDKELKDVQKIINKDQLTSEIADFKNIKNKIQETCKELVTKLKNLEELIKSKNLQIDKQQAERAEINKKIEELKNAQAKVAEQLATANKALKDTDTIPVTGGKKKSKRSSKRRSKGASKRKARKASKKRGKKSSKKRSKGKSKRRGKSSKRQ